MTKSPLSLWQRTILCSVPFCLILLFCMPRQAYTQTRLINAVREKLPRLSDSMRYADALNRISSLYIAGQLDSSYKYAKEAQVLSDRIHYPKGLADAYMNLASCFTFLNNSRLAHRFYMEALQRFKSMGDSAGICQATYNIGSYYHYEGRPAIATPYITEALAIGSRLLSDSAWSPMLANYYRMFAEDSLRQDSARWALHKARDIAIRYHDDRMITYTGLFMANERFRNKELLPAMEDLKKLSAHAIEEGMMYLAVYANAQLDLYSTSAGMPDSIIYKQKMLDAAVMGGYKKLMTRPVTALYRHYKAINAAAAIPYADVMSEIAAHQEELRTQGELDYTESFLHEQELKALRLNNALQEQTIETDRLEKNKRIMLIIFLTVCSVLLGGLLASYYRSFRNSRQKTKHFREAAKLVHMQNKELQRHDDFKNKLLSILAHDFRLPLGHIIKVTELFTQKDIQAEQFREIAVNIASRATETLALFETVLRWIKSQLAGFEYAPQVHVLKDLWNEVREPLSQEISDKELIVEVHIPPELKIQADHEMLQFVHRNLLHNAVKFSLRGSRITIFAAREADHTFVSITNEGSGISANDQPYIFDYKTPGKIARETGRGAGLALIICKDFIEKMGGTISVKSDGTHYTTFEYTI